MAGPRKKTTSTKTTKSRGKGKTAQSKTNADQKNAAEEKPTKKKLSTKDKIINHKELVNTFVENYIPPPNNDKRKTTRQQKANWPGNNDPDISRDVLAHILDPYSKIRLLAMWGMKQEHIALIFDLSKEMLQSRLECDDELRVAYDKGHAEGIANMAGALYINGITGNVSAQMFFMRVVAGWRDPIPVEGEIDVSHGFEKAVKEFNDNVLPHIGEEIVRRAAKETRPLDS